MKAYNTIYEGGTDEIVEKKSRFSAQVFPVETEEEVATILEQMLDITVMLSSWEKLHKSQDAAMMENHPGRPADRSWK